MNSVSETLFDDFLDIGKDPSETTSSECVLSRNLASARDRIGDYDSITY